MPFDAQGNFSRVMNWRDDAANDISILASRHDAEDDNFASGFNNTVCRDGRATMTGNLKMGSNKITGLGNATNANDAVNKSQLDTKANDNAVVKLAGTQEITGGKTFVEPVVVKNNSNSASALYTQKTDVEKGTAPSATRSGGVTLYDKNGTTTENKLAQAILEYRSDGTTRAGVQASSPISGSSASSSINIVGNTDGTFTTYAPANSAVNSIVTTTGISKAQNGYVKLGNGIIIQWGKSTGGEHVTFSQPFTSNSSFGISTGYVNSIAGDHQYGCPYNISSTGFDWVRYNANSVLYWTAIGY